MRALAVIVLLSIAPSARAQELGVAAEVEAPISSTGGDDPTASATELDAQRRPTALDTLENALREAPGARVIATGAYGAPATLGLRGADAEQLEVLLDDVPLTSADGGAFDLSTIPLWTLERVEIYRSGAPTWLGMGGIGGVLRLMPRRAHEEGRHYFGTIGFGSFGYLHGRAGARVSDGRGLEWITAVGATTSDGEFPYVDGANTALTEEDDVERTRTNGAVRDASAVGHLRVRLPLGHARAFVLASERLAGVPGPAASPTRFARRNETAVTAALAWEATERDRDARDADWRIAAAASGGLRRRRFDDRFGEIGLVPSVTDDLQGRSVVRLAGSGRALPWLELTGVGVWTHEELAPGDRRARRDDRDSSRDLGALAAEARFFGRIDDVRFDLRPSARAVLSHSRLHDLRPDEPSDAQVGETFAPTVRVAGAIEPWRGVAFSLSAASATRLPSMVELFGDRGYLQGDPTLRPERGETIDGGVVLAGRHDVWSGRAELRGFVTFQSDMIRYRRTSQYTAVPENVASATLYGGELGVRGSITRFFDCTIAATVLDTRTDYLGRTRRLPLRPSLVLLARPTVRAIDVGPFSQMEWWAELSHVGSSYVGAANEASGEIPARTRVGLGVSLGLFEGRARVDASVTDLFDQRGFDLLGFPLPGRSASVAFTVDSD